MPVCISLDLVLLGILFHDVGSEATLPSISPCALFRLAPRSECDKIGKSDSCLYGTWSKPVQGPDSGGRFHVELRYTYCVCTITCYRVVVLLRYNPHNCTPSHSSFVTTLQLLLELVDKWNLVAGCLLAWNTYVRPRMKLSYLNCSVSY